MVLHSSKWDRKATRKYNRKHGIGIPKPVVTEDLAGNARKWRKGDEESAEDSNQEENEQKYTINENEQIDNTIEDSGEDNDLLEDQRSYEELSDEPRNYCFPESDDEEYQELVELSKKMILKKQEEEHEREKLRAKQLPDDDDDDHLLVQDNIHEYLRLLQEIEHSKVAANIKKKFGNKKNLTTNNQEQDFDDFLEDLDGSGQDNHSNPTTNSQSRNLTAKLDEKKKDWLDGLLG